MTREEKLWTMTGNTLLGVAEGLGLNVNKNTLKQGKEKLIAKILEAEKKLENGANNEQMEASEEVVPVEETEQAVQTEEKPKRKGRTRSTTSKTSKEVKEPKTPAIRSNLKLKELTYKGETKTIREWAEQLEMPWATLYDRVNRNGWSVEDAIEIPLGQRRG